MFQAKLLRLAKALFNLLPWIDEDEAKKTQEALLAMSQLEHEVGDFLGLNQK